MADPGIYNPRIRLLVCERTVLGPRWTYHDYTAPYWRLYWNDTPGAAVYFRDTGLDLKPGLMVLIPPETAYAARCRGFAQHAFIHFLCDAPYHAPAPGLYAFAMPAELRRMAATLFAAGGNNEATVRHRSLQALALVHAALPHMPEAALRPAPDDLRVRDVIQVIDGQPTRPPDNETLARIAGMNTNAFIRLFREVTGITPHAWSMRRRIEKACLLLHHSTMKIDAIALECGFCDRYHFTRVFTRLRGVGPALFRRRTGYENR